MYACRYYYSLLSVREISHSVEFKFILNHIVAVLIRLSYTFSVKHDCVMTLRERERTFVTTIYMTLEMG